MQYPTMCGRIEFLMKNYLHVQIFSFRGLLLAQWAIFDTFGPPCEVEGGPKSVKIFDLSEVSGSIKSLVRNYFSVQTRSFWAVTLCEMANF